MMGRATQIQNFLFQKVPRNLERGIGGGGGGGKSFLLVGRHKLVKLVNGWQRNWFGQTHIQPILKLLQPKPDPSFILKNPNPTAC